MIYFIRAGIAGPVKIGVAKNVSQRLRGLQTAHHQKLNIIREIEGERSDEQKLHRAFAPYRITGEWFTYTDSMLVISPSDIPDIPFVVNVRHRQDNYPAVSFRLSKEQLAELETKAAAKGWKLSAYLKWRLFRRSKRSEDRPQ